MKGLIALYGGEKGFESKLDSLFTVPWNPKYIARNVETMIGQYCHGNQPDHEAPVNSLLIMKPAVQLAGFIMIKFWFMINYYNFAELKIFYGRFKRIKPGSRISQDFWCPYPG